MVGFSVHFGFVVASAALCIALAFVNHHQASLSLSRSAHDHHPVRVLGLFDSSSPASASPSNLYKPVFLNDSPDGILPFIQISDLHVSQFRTKGGIEHLFRFLSSELPLIAPELVVATGDLTDAKDKRKLKSKQYESEWIAYRSILESSGVLQRKPHQDTKINVFTTDKSNEIESTFWWDQRGNHDCFNVPEFLNSRNRYGKMSVTKAEGYALHISKDYGTYSFIGIDGCPKLGITRPFNFFAYLDNNDMDFLETNSNAYFYKNNQSNLNRNPSNHTFVMAHYPTATMLFGTTSSGKNFDMLAHHFSIWLSGHLHRLFAGLGNKMYAYHDDSDLLELEVADMKDHGIFRLIVIDNDMLSFKDISLDYDLPHLNSFDLKQNPIIDASKINIEDRKPIIIITNPRDSKFAIPLHERENGILNSTHIRVLIYVKNPKLINQVNAYIDDDTSLGQLIYSGKGNSWKSKNDKNINIPLWTIPWNPINYNDDQIHKIKIKLNYNNQEYEEIVPFIVSSDKRINNMESGIGGSILKIHIGILFKELFMIVYFIILVFFLIIPRLYTLYLISNDKYDEFRMGLSKKLQEIDMLSINYYQYNESLECVGLQSQGSEEELISPLSPFSPTFNDIEDNEDLEKIQRPSVLSKSNIRIKDIINRKSLNSLEPRSTGQFRVIGPFRKIWIDFQFFLRATLLRLCELSRINFVWWPMFIVMLFFIVGPSFIGNFIPSSNDFDSRYGFMMLSGIKFFNGYWVPLLDTWVFAFEELLYNIFPIMIYLSFCITPANLLYSSENERLYNPLHQRWYVRMMMVSLFIYQIMNASMISIFYGPIALLIGPTKSWYVIWSIIMFWKFQRFSTENPKEYNTNNGTEYIINNIDEDEDLDLDDNIDDNDNEESIKLKNNKSNIINTKSKRSNSQSSNSTSTSSDERFSTKNNLRSRVKK